MRPFVWTTILLISVLCAQAHDYAERIAPLIAPAKLATLARPWGKYPRSESHLLAGQGQARSGRPRHRRGRCHPLADYTNALAAELTKGALIRNLDIATQLGCLDAEGMAEMRKRNSPTVRRGPYRGQELSVDHIIPRSVVTELDCGLPIWNCCRFV